VLAPGSVWFTYAFNVAIALVNQQLNQVPGPIYMLAVYNLGADNLISWAQDPSPPVPYPSDNPGGVPYLQFLRQQWNISGFNPGVVMQASDQGTAAILVPLEQYKNYTLGQLQNLKTPYGRQYLAFAASVGSLWGLS
jgi:hypothetical protein